MTDDDSAKQILNLIKTKKSNFWEKEKQRNALALFHKASERVPAYKDFLKKEGVSPKKIKTWDDFQNVPPVSKKNYLRQYPLEKLSTSGSTGEPFYFPRSERLDWESSLVHEMFLENSLHGSKGPTLVLVCFGMGVWIGGLLTYKGFEIAARRGGYPISILTPGINKKEIYNALTKLSPSFSQTILVGYPPFIKDVLDGARGEGIELKKLNLRLSFAAETFTENFRDYLVEMTGLKNPCLDTINIYGSADIGAMGFETPLSILIRRIANREQDGVFSSIFGAISKTPTLAQYNPTFITFEAPKGEILLTGDNAIPLIRYSIGDHGGVFSFDEITNKLFEHGIGLQEEIKGTHLAGHISELPFVYVYERADFSTTLYGLQIYPEHIREALIKAPIRKFLTGKFTIVTNFDKHQNQYLEINLEMLRNVKMNKKLEALILKQIVASLEKKNSEFRELHRSVGDRAIPHLVFWASEDIKYFPPGIKQKWVIQSR
jgi:phenylacetate-CoA ligase